MKEDNIDDIVKLSKQLGVVINAVKKVIYEFTEGQTQLTDRMRAMLAFNLMMNLHCQVLVDYVGGESFESLFQQTIDNMALWKDGFIKGQEKVTLN